MSSLVAYEDSESEDDYLDQTEEGASVSVQAGIREQNQEVRMCNSSEVMSPHSFTPAHDRSVLEYHGDVSERSSSSLHPHSLPQSCSDWERKYRSDRAAQEKHFRDTAAPLSLPAIQETNSLLQTIPPIPQSFSDGLNSARRHHAVLSGVRPYIPKRQRLATLVETVDPKYPAEQVPGNQTRENQILSDVSARVKPHLAHKPGAAGIPRRLLMSLGGHQGPVNTVQWCPVPHLSHLLLSASMDKTFKVVKVYKAGIQQTLDILFLKGGVDFITSSDCVSRDSADRTLIAWDYQTTAKVSNQIYQERYTCPSLAVHPLEESFVAQTNGDYMAVFSSQQPYRMNKRRRYEGHKVEGYAVQCEFSLDGTILASGSSTGSAHFYDYHSVRMLHTLHAHSQPCLCVSQHPVLPATAATCDWAGEIKVWH
ncbi:WD repeat-containing protein 25 isoform X3 [Sander vitreus]